MDRVESVLIPDRYASCRLTLQQQAQTEGLMLRKSKADHVKRHHLESRDLPGGR